MINNMLIGTKLRFNFLIIIIGIVIIVANTYFSLKKIETEYNKAQKIQMEASYLKSMLVGGLMLNSAKGVVLQNPNDIKAIGGMQDGIDKITSFYQKLKKSSTSLAKTIEQETLMCKKSAQTMIEKAKKKQQISKEDLKISLKAWRALKKGIMKPLKPLKSELNVSKKEYKSLINTTVVSLLFGSLALIVILFILNMIISRNIVSHVKIFEQGLLGFFQYLNKETHSSELISLDSTDEIGSMAKLINENIDKTNQSINADNKFIGEVKTIVNTIKDGYLDKRLENRVQNEALEDLRLNINEMLNTLQLKICTNINDISKSLDKYAKLDFTHRISGCNSDVTMGLNNLADIINEMLVINKENGLTLDISSDILLDNVSLLNKNSNDAAARLEETAAAIEEVTSNIVNNNSNIEKMSQLAANLNISSQSGKGLANETNSAMDEINSQVAQINDAIGVIDQIAFQTNILSLNAAVEAATAGEAGKGFAVVAAEVRNLATRSADAANDIKRIVEIATKKADEGKLIANKMIGGYGELSDNIMQTTTIIQEVETSSKEQQQGIEQINDAINSLDQQTQQNANIASQTYGEAVQTDKIAKMIVSDANEKNFIGKDEVKAKKVDIPSLEEKPKITKKENTPQEIKSNSVKVESKTFKEEKSDDEWESF